MKKVLNTFQCATCIARTTTRFPCSLAFIQQIVTLSSKLYTQCDKTTADINSAELPRGSAK